MIDVDRLNNTITELEQQSEKMKTASEYYSQLIEVSGEVAATSSAQNDINERIEETSKQLANLKDESKQLINAFQSSSEKITKDIKILEDEILKDVQALSSENNKLYSEFQQSLNSKLELFKSDMQLEIRGTASRLQNSIDTNITKIKEQVKSDLDENKVVLDKMQSNIMKSLEIQNKGIKANKNIIVVIAIVTIITLMLNIH